jgi:hypothetical protein
MDKKIHKTFNFFKKVSGLEELTSLGKRRQSTSPKQISHGMKIIP